jgi:AcrR family transcriptional regulator
MVAAIRLSKQNGYMSVTRDDIADEAKCASSLVHHYYGTMTQLRRAIMRRAIEMGELKIIAQGLASKDRHARKADPDVKQAALASLMG